MCEVSGWVRAILECLLAWLWYTGSGCCERTAHGAAGYTGRHRHVYIRCNTLRRTATHCNSLQHTATHCNSLQQAATLALKEVHVLRLDTQVDICVCTHPSKTLQRTAAHCSTRQHTVTLCNALKRTAPQYGTAVCINLQHWL